MSESAANLINLDYVMAIEPSQLLREVLSLVAFVALLKFVIPATKGALSVQRAVRGLTFALVPAFSISLTILIFNPKNSVQIFILLSLFTIDVVGFCGLPTAVLLTWLQRREWPSVLALIYVTSFIYCIVRAYSIMGSEQVAMNEPSRFIFSAIWVEVLLLAFYWGGRIPLVKHSSHRTRN